jgi:hypothetical protein
VSPSIDELHPAQNRGFRELYAAAGHVVNHYRALGKQLDEPALTEGERTARRLLDELRTETERYDLHGFPAAQNAGVTAARARNGVGDRFLERNQALRLAVLDVQHVVTLLGYLSAASEANGNADLAAFCSRWQETLGECEDRVRAAAIDMGRRPDEAVEPVDASTFGRAAHAVGYWAGTFGEWFDRRAARRRS